MNNNDTIDAQLLDLMLRAGSRWVLWLLIFLSVLSVGSCRSQETGAFWRDVWLQKRTFYQINYQIVRYYFFFYKINYQNIFVFFFL